MYSCCFRRSAGESCCSDRSSSGLIGSSQSSAGDSIGCEAEARGTTARTSATGSRDCRLARQRHGADQARHSAQARKSSSFEENRTSMGFPFPLVSAPALAVTHDVMPGSYRENPSAVASEKDKLSETFHYITNFRWTHRTRRTESRRPT